MMNERKHALVHTLAKCVHVCNHCFNSCLEEEDVKMMKECIRLDKECSLICATTLQILSKNSYFKKDMIELCQKVCKACADECRKHQNDHCQLCARICNECAEECGHALENTNSCSCE